MIVPVDALPAVSAAFLASFVELVEAFTIVLAAATVAGWGVALTGAAVGVAILVVLVAALGPLITLIPFKTLQLAIGVLLLLFGMRWLRKAILRRAGFMALHDEARIFAQETGSIEADAQRGGRTTAVIAGITACKGVLLEGIEVVFIVLAVGAGKGLIVPASIGALIAGLIVAAIGLIVHKPLTRVPENTLKLLVGVMLTAFGAFWTGEGLGADWPGGDLTLLGLAALFLGLALGLAAVLRPRAVAPEAAQ
ncbi:MAG: hypothetical protein P4L82_08745 [Ancalomicrobiaceae bacterium]|nr:hypothetical protein [Ancalomicrobiaceae bacterium]